MLQGERDVRQTEFDLLDDAARSLAQEKTTSLDSLMDTFLVRKRNAMAMVIAMDEQIEELDKEIWLLNNTHKGETAAVVTATLLAKRDCKIEFQLTYRKRFRASYSPSALTLPRSGDWCYLAAVLRPARHHVRREALVGRLAPLLREHHPKHG